MTVAIRQYANTPAGTLNGTINDSATTLTITAVTGFPATPEFTIRIDSELMLVTAISGAVYTVTRGAEGSDPVPHLDGAPILMPLTVAALQALVVQSHGGTVVAARRQLNFVDGGGVTWTLTDDPTNNKVDVSAASGGGGGGSGFEAAFTVPALASYTWINQGTATANDTDGKGVFLRCPPASQDNYRALVIATGSTPWVYVAKVVPLVFTNTNSCSGVIVCGGSGDPRSYIIRLNNGSIDVIKLNSLTSYNDNPTGTLALEGRTQLTWMRIANDGSNVTFQVSSDGANWTQIYTVAVGFGGLDHAGFFAESASGGFDACAKLVSSKVN